MQDKLETYIAKLNKKISSFENEEDINLRPVLMNQIHNLTRQIQKLIQQPQYQKKHARLEKQLQVVKLRVQRLEKQMIQQIRFYQRMSNQFSNQEFKYNARMSIQQNVLRSVLLEEINQNQLGIKPSELQEIAKRVETNKQVLQQIQQLIVEQGQNLQVVTQNIEQTHKNIVNANQNLEEANSLQSGKPIKKNESKNQSNSKLSKIKSNIKSTLGGFGYKIKDFFEYLFHKKKPVETKSEISQATTVSASSNVSEI